MYEFFIMIADFWSSLWSELELAVFDIGGTSVNLASIILVLLIVAMVMGIFWKGAKA